MQAPARQRITVVVADDHPLYRDGLVRAIASRLDLDLVGEAADGARAAALIEEHEPDVALLDVEMPKPDGIELCARLTETPRRRTRVVLLSAWMNEALVAEAVQAGAAGYLGKDSSREEICDAVAIAARDGTVFCAGASSGVIRALERSFEQPPAEPGPSGC